MTDEDLIRCIEQSYVLNGLLGDEWRSKLWHVIRMERRIAALEETLRTVSEGLDEIDSEASWKQHREVRETVQVLQKSIDFALSQQEKP